MAQRSKMEKFLKVVLSGQAENAESYMRQAHKGLIAKGLSDQHFNRVAGHLKDVLDELDVPGHLQTEIMAAVAGLKDAVLNRAQVIDLAAC